MDQILGQTAAIDTLRTVLASGRVHHAWIFHGPPGVGKHTAALAFAAILLDPAASPNLAGIVEADPEGETSRLIRAGTHPDLHLIAKELASYSRETDIRRRKQMTIPVEVVREFVVEPAFRSGHVPPGARASKVFIIDEAELLAPAGQNVLLKTLEEPPAGTVLILVSSNEDRLLPTIRSRCQRVGFGSLPDEAMQQWMSANHPDLDAGKLEWAMRFSQGSPGLATAALSQGLYDWYTTLAPMLRDIESGQFPEEMGTTMADLIGEWAKAWVKANPSASKDAANKQAARYLFTLLAQEVRMRLHGAVAEGSPPDRYVIILDFIRDAERNLRSNVHLGMLLESLVMQWASLPAEVDMTTLV